MFTPNISATTYNFSTNSEMLNFEMNTNNNGQCQYNLNSFSATNLINDFTQLEQFTNNYNNYL